MMNWEFENSLISEDIRENFICGTDEAGRGPLAGDVYAAAVILPHGIEIDGLFDSKILSPKRRERLFDIIVEKALDYAIESATINEIDKINILNASLRAMRRAVDKLNIKPDFVLIDGLFDSKILSPKRREKLYEIIIDKAVDYAVESATINEIDKINILNASLRAMRRAVDKLKIKPDFVLVDGHIVRGFDDLKAVGVVKGDTVSPNIAAASILAKVARDRYMRELAEFYPLYKFENNKGYGTAEHIYRLKMFGKSPVHRESFLRKILPEGELPQIEIEEM
jgi:ribonuclease HII